MVQSIHHIKSPYDVSYQDQIMLRNNDVMDFQDLTTRIFSFCKLTSAPFLTRGRIGKMAARQDLPWMPPPQEQVPIGCPPGLQYLTQIDQLLVHQQIEILECQSLP